MEGTQQKVAAQNIMGTLDTKLQLINQSRVGLSKNIGGTISPASKSKSAAKEVYKPQIDYLEKWSNSLDVAKNRVDELQDALKNTESFNEQESILNRLVGATKEQINATNDLKNAQVGQINDYINQLRNYGFAIDYNSQKNELYIKNMERLGAFTGDTAKDIEKLIKETQSLNKDNVSLDGSIRDLTSDVKDYYEQISDIPEKKLEKFNELMGSFQESQLQAIKDQVTDLEHALDNDPQIKALQEQLDLLEKQTDEADRQAEAQEKQLAIEKARIALENAQKQKTLQVYRGKDMGWVYETDPEAVASAQEELTSAEKDYSDFQIDTLKEDIQSQIDILEKGYQDQIDSLNNFVDEQEYLIEKAGRESVETFSELSNKLAEFGLNNQEYLGKATTWLQEYQSALAGLGTTMNSLRASGSIPSGVISTAGTTGINTSSISTALSGGLLSTNYGTAGTNNNYTISIDKIELPGVTDASGFVDALKNLPNLAIAKSSKRN